ncbi:folylpolyglutamate synthase, mitochondrial [Scaptodrosophila lebanonensis]|uniref:Folylpolyglutamate synthase, mitochondrial n=1 Tax=Drosophila lebanonensis TaxID=7225 RepID=A0A6J2U7X6_DROLE|nr:folylpolyglutamate synthase, mitochondrial [Scaptodrosophila lebanonensis]
MLSLPKLFVRRSCVLRSCLAATSHLPYSNNFFKMNFKPLINRDKQRKNVASIKELIQDEEKPHELSPQATPPSNNQQQHQEVSASKDRMPSVPKQKLPPPPQIEQKRRMLPAPQVNQNRGSKSMARGAPAERPNISNQRDKWVARVSPEMQRKLKAAGQNPVPQVMPSNQSQHSDSNPLSANNQFFGASQTNQEGWQKPKMDDEDKQIEIKGASTEKDRKSWLNRMKGTQQKKQSEWLKEMQLKQEAGRQLHQQRVQQLQKQTPPMSGTQHSPQMAAANQTATSTQAPSEPAPPKSPERQAYLAAVKELNSYQMHDPAPGRAQTKIKAQSSPVIQETIACLEKTGLGVKDLERIPVIQVAGSKGRGSTCAIVESILRAHGVKTGVLCSPHMFLTSERIRIDGEPLSDVQFSELFWKLNHMLRDGAGPGNISPPAAYSKLLTIMAFHAFQEANVEVAIIEVGSGGANDCTNITEHARTIGISTLGWEQSFDLSSSMRDIAWNKAAIMKPKANIFINVTQPECCEVLTQRAKQLGADLHRVPNFQSYIDGNMANKALLTKAHHSMRLNGSLAIQLAYDYLRTYKPQYVVGFDANTIQLTQAAARGIETFHQPGHFQFIKHDMFHVYLDSADSLESMMACREWFYTKTRSNRTPKILLFNKVTEFNAKDLLTVLRHNLRFEEACFVPSPNYFEGENLEEDDSSSMVWHGMEELQRAKRNASNWRALCEESGRKDNSQLSISIGAFFEYLQNKYGKQKYGMRSDLDVLVTGSRKLVAATITTLDKMKRESGF